MAPTVTFVRHAQGYHNLNVAGHKIRDPHLTPYGEQQCTHLSNTFPSSLTPDLIVVSPLKRTIYTALLSFPKAIADRNLTLIALPELQETSDLPCDTGSSKAELQREFPNAKIDFSRVEDGWESKTGKWAPVRSAIEERCRVARRWLMDRPESSIVVVTHGGLLHYLTEDWTDMNRAAGTGWTNTEYRTYTFAPADRLAAALIETGESATRRRGVEKPMSEAEKRNLKRVAQQEMLDEGYLRDVDGNAQQHKSKPVEESFKVAAKV